MPTYEWERVFGREFAALDSDSQEAFLAAVAQFVDDLRTDRERWRASVGASSVDPFDLLATPIGAECAGAVQFEPAFAAGPSGRRSSLEPVTDDELAAGLRDLVESARSGGWRLDRLVEQIDQLPAPLRSAGAPTRLLNAMTQRSHQILAP